MRVKRSPRLEPGLDVATHTDGATVGQSKSGRSTCGSYRYCRPPSQETPAQAPHDPAPARCRGIAAQIALNANDIQHIQKLCLQLGQRTGQLLRAREELPLVAYPRTQYLASRGHGCLGVLEICDTSEDTEIGGASPLSPSTAKGQTACLVGFCKRLDGTSLRSGV